VAVHRPASLRTSPPNTAAQETPLAVLSALSADAALLAAAERGRRVRDQAAVQPHHAGLDASGDAQASAIVSRADVGDEWQDPGGVLERPLVPEP